jgi:hypothetical protein
MALTKCQDCGREVPAAALYCRNCGRAIAKPVRRAGAAWEGAGFVTLLIGVAACFAVPPLGGMMLLAGFLVFLVGRFL